jgi:hypothetical protein
MKNVKKKYSRIAKKRNWLANLLLVLAVLVLIITGLEATNTTHFFHHSQTVNPVSASSATKGEASTRGKTTASSTTSGNDKNTGGQAVNTTAVLLSPTGTFVSNHHLSLSNSSSSQIASNCTTTPGASCEIVFTNGSTVKSLPSQTTDVGGSTFWTWKLQDIGITAGSWSIQAKATLGSQAQTAADALNLEVTQ